VAPNKRFRLRHGWSDSCESDVSTCVFELVSQLAKTGGLRLVAQRPLEPFGFSGNIEANKHCIAAKPRSPTRAVSVDPQPSLTIKMQPDHLRLGTTTAAPYTGALRITQRRRYSSSSPPSAEASSLSAPAIASSLPPSPSLSPSVSLSASALAEASSAWSVGCSAPES